MHLQGPKSNKVCAILHHCGFALTQWTIMHCVLMQTGLFFGPQKGTQNQTYPRVYNILVHKYVWNPWNIAEWQH